MKRRAKVAKTFIQKKTKKCFTLFFWKRCTRCGQEFRQEKGYSCINTPRYSIRNHFKWYLCNDCVKSHGSPHESYRISSVYWSNKGRENAEHYFQQRLTGLTTRPGPRILGESAGTRVVTTGTRGTLMETIEESSKPVEKKEEKKEKKKLESPHLNFRGTL